MTDSSDLFRRRDEIRELIANNESLEAVRKLMDLVRDFSKDYRYLDDVTVISADLRQVEDDLRRSGITYTKAREIRRKIIYSSLDLMRDVVAAACAGGAGNA